MRVRASAGAASFRREATLKEHLERAQTLQSELLPSEEDSEQKGSPRQQQARARARREHLERLEAALKELPQARKAKPKDKQDQARVSTTDAEARVMKMQSGRVPTCLQLSIGSRYRESSNCGSRCDKVTGAIRAKCYP